MLKKNLFVGALSLLLLSACSKNEDTSAHDHAVPVKVATVETKTVPFYRNGVGYVRAPSDVTVYSQVQGQILSQSFQEGDFIRKGSPLFTIDPRPFQAKLDGAIADIEQIQAEIAYQESLLERYEKLVKNEYVSQDVFDKALSQLKELKASLRDANAEKAKAEVDLEYCYISAPFDGVIGITNVDPGTSITDTTQPLVSLRSIDPIYVDFVLPQKDLSTVRKFKDAAGDKNLVVHVKSTSGVKETGVLKTIQNAVQTQTGTINLRAEFKNSEKSLWPGEYVEAMLVLKNLDDAVLVPQAAIRVNEKGSYVYVVKDDKTVEVRNIDLGQRIENDYVVNSGLKKGDMVVVLGQLMLAPGAKVTW